MSQEPEENYRRSCCDELLAHPSTAYDSDQDPAETDSLLAPSVEEDLHAPTISAARLKSLRRRAVFIRTLALLCTCSLSIGSHYASYILGPLKSRLSRELGTSHTEFSLLISAFSLNSTWTPLVGGVLASTLGTTLTSILATGVIFIGVILLLFGDLWGDVRLMTLGLFIFGLGVSPLAVVQETIIVRFFKSHGLGVSMAFGLLAGKGASFISARTSYPLTERFGPHAPFYMAAFLAGFSMIVNFVYIAAAKWLVNGAGAELEATDITEEAKRRAMSNMSEAQALEKVAAKRRVNLRQITKLGDVFWAYVGLNILCGTIWSPFTHLAANIIQTRYQMTEEAAANHASYLLAGSIFLYPICGFVVDKHKHKPIVVQLLMLSSILTLCAYTWLALPPAWTKTASPAIAIFGLGHGYAPLLLVVLVPKIVPLKYVSTALGVHKSLEQTGSTLFQTAAGLSLDMRKGSSAKPSNTAIQYLLNIFLILNILQLCSVLGLAHLQRLRNSAVRAVRHRLSFSQSSEHTPSIHNPRLHPSSDTREEEPLLGHQRGSQYLSIRSFASGEGNEASREDRQFHREVKRGEVFACMSALLIISAWVLFLGTAWFRLGSKHGKSLL